MILGDPEAFWLAIERMGIKPGDARYPDDVVAAYRAQIDDPATSRRCARTTAPARRSTARSTTTTAARARSPARRGRCGAARARCRSSTRTRSSCGGRTRRRSTGRAIEGASHFLVEDAPGEVADDLAGFFAAGS